MTEHHTKEPPEFISKDIYHERVLWTRQADTLADAKNTLASLKRQQTHFAHLSVMERTHALLAFADRLDANKEHLAVMVCEEVGRCLKECRAELDKSLQLIRYYAHLAPELLAQKTIATQASLSCVSFEPLGLVFAVMPWNYPVWQLLRFAIPALCSGNACVVKPAPSVGRVTAALFDIVGDELPFRALFLAHQDVESCMALCDAFAFTGSAKTGRYLAGLAGKHLKKSVLELGGSNAFIVLDDADIETAAKDACYSRFRDAGQSCNAAKRIIVTPTIADAFIDAFLAHCKTLKTGHPMLESTSLAPMHLAEGLGQMQGFVDEALEKGARILLGGVLSQTGAAYPATVLDYVSIDMRVAQEEVFGPVVPIIRAKNAEDAVNLANATPFGLGAAIYSQNEKQAWEYARVLACGSVFINRHTSSDLRLPFGGVKDSGYGRELSEFGLYEFVNIKSYWQR